MRNLKQKKNLFKLRIRGVKISRFRCFLQLTYFLKITVDRMTDCVRRCRDLFGKRHRIDWRGPYRHFYIPPLRFDSRPKRKLENSLKFTGFPVDFQMTYLQVPRHQHFNVSHCRRIIDFSFFRYIQHVQHATDVAL